MQLVTQHLGTNGADWQCLRVLQDRIDEDDLMANRDAREEPQGLSDANRGAIAMPTPHALLGSGMRDDLEERLVLQRASSSRLRHSKRAWS